MARPRSGLTIAGVDIVAPGAVARVAIPLALVVAAVVGYSMFGRLGVLAGLGLVMGAAAAECGLSVRKGPRHLVAIAIAAVVWAFLASGASILLTSLGGGA